MALYEDAAARVAVCADLRFTLDHSRRLPVSLQSGRAVGENGFFCCEVRRNPNGMWLFSPEVDKITAVFLIRSETHKYN